MKIIAAIMLLGGSSAMAMPAVGDYVNFNVVVTQGTQGAKGELSEKLTAYDAATQMFSAEVTQKFNGQTKTSKSQVKDTDLLTNEQVADAVTNCAEYQGTAENIAISSTETVATCKLAFSDNQGSGYQWIGSVAFGLVKMVYKLKNGQVQTFTVKSYVYGK